MHISEGVLSLPVLSAGYGITISGLALGYRELHDEKIVRTAVFSSAFFIASLIHVPIGPGSAHLILNGLVGILLGWASFCAIFVGLLLQAILFQFGGLTTLGVNTCTMAIPAMLSYYLCRPLLRRRGRVFPAAAGILAGASGVAFSALLVALSLWLSGDQFLPVARLTLVFHLPVMIVEGIITMGVLQFLLKIKPEILEGM